MPISNWAQIPAIMNEVHRLQPLTVLDLGVGFGKYGPLLREVLDGMYGRCRSSQWTAQLVGYEAHLAYRNACWETYNVVWNEDFAARPITMGYDVALMIDSLEHLDPERGMLFLRELVARNRHVIISVPVVPMPQGAVYGNEFETHRTHYDGTEFEEFQPVTLYKGMTQAFSIKGLL